MSRENKRPENGPASRGVRVPPRTAAAAAVASAALALPLAAATPALAQRPAGRSVPHAQIAGDGFLTPFATGSDQLIGGGVRFDINDAITFSTTSSASAAVSEATMTAPRNDVSTADGGTTTATLGDAFDGYNSLAVHVGSGAPEGVPPQAGSPDFTIYNKNGAAEPGCATGQGPREYTYQPQVDGDLTMSRRVWVPADAPIARWEDVFTNTGDTPMTLTAYVANNLGSDANTRITGSSSGDDVAMTDDDWVGTFQNWAGTTSSDPRLAHVLQGPGASTPLAGVTIADGDNSPTWSYELTLAPGQTRILLNYVVAEANIALAAQRAQAIVADPPADCLTPDEQSGVANFDLDSTAPTLSLPPTQTVTASAGADGATVDYTATASDAHDGDVPVTCTPPSGSVFPIGTTTVTCRAEDAAGNVANGSFDVVVAAAAPPPPATTDTTPPPVTTPPPAPSPTPKPAARPKAPALTLASVGPRCSTAVGGRLPRLVASYRLAAAATVTIQLQTRDLKHPWTRCPAVPDDSGTGTGSAPPPRHWDTLKLVRQQQAAGSHAIAFMRRVVKRLTAHAASAKVPVVGNVGLVPGSYRIVIEAHNAAGTRKQIRNFVVLAPRRPAH